MCVENVVEDIQHLFFGCPFSDTCWTYLGVHWDLTLDFQAMVLHARIQFNSVIFIEVFIIGCWSLWCHRNDNIFDVAPLSFSQWRRFFISELQVVSLMVKPRVKEKIRIFMSSLFLIPLPFPFGPAALYNVHIFFIYKEIGVGASLLIPVKKKLEEGNPSLPT
jgi:hypothetical protein